MKKLKIIFSLAIAVSLVFACTLRLGHPVESQTVEVEITCGIDGIALGSKAAGIVGDPAVNTVHVVAQDENGIYLDGAMLDKGTSSWTGSMSVTVTVGTPIAFIARGYSGYEGRGTILYYGKSEVTVSPSDVTLSVSISTALQETAQWAQSVVSAENAWSFFNNVAVDSSGNVLAVGSQAGQGQFSYGDVSAAGTSNGDNVMLVKYDSSGTAQWARTVSAGSGDSRYNGVAVDGSGNVYAAGYQSGSGAYTYGPGISATGTADENIILVKYDSSGIVYWAKTVSAGSGNSYFNGVAVDSDANVYAVGYQFGSGAYTYGSGISATGTSEDNNPVLVKYNSSGTAQWVQTIMGGSGYSRFIGVSVDSSGNIYTAGHQGGSGPYTYGPGVGATGTYTGENVILAKYESSGIVYWAKTVSAGPGSSMFTDVSVDSAGNIYAVGIQLGTESYTHYDGVSVAGTCPFFNLVLVKYGK